MAQQDTQQSAGGQATLTDYPKTPVGPLTEADLPERSFAWEDEPTEGKANLSIVLPEGDISLGDRYLSHGKAAYILNNTEQYLDEYADHEIDVPKYYSEMDDLQTYVGMATTLSSGYGIGIDSWALEMAVRFATGGGRYSPRKLTVIGCEGKPFVVRAPDGDFLLDPARVSRPEDYEPPQADVGPFSIEEGHSDVIDGVKLLLNDAETFLDLVPASYEGRSSNSHRFAFDNDDKEIQQRRVSGGDCQRRSAITTAPEDVLGTFTINTAYDEHYECELDELAYERGDECRQGVCVGYSTHYSDPRQSSRVSMTGNITANIDYHYLYRRDVSAPELDLRQKTEKIAEFTPREESYHPISSHL